jgi:photosystem II stability/assembly factor-like uncharacterized protein
MKTKKSSNKIFVSNIINFFLRIIYVLIINLVLFSGIAKSQWIQQTLPISGQINDMEFFDAYTGIIAMNTTPPYILRTTNGGNNWTIGMSIRVFFMSKADDSTVYGNGRIPTYDLIYRTFDRGLTWDSVALSASITYCSVAFVDKDTGWISGYDGNINRMYKTTNGGINIFSISSQTGYGILSFLKQKYNGEYYGWNITSGFLLKTTNSGVNWINIPNPLGGGTYNSISFLNKDTGWCYFIYNIRPSEIIFTSNGGLNWVTQYIDSNNSYSQIHFENDRKGWAGTDGFRIFATSNGGITWGKQVLPFYYGGPHPKSFVDSLLGWIGENGNNLAKTTNGGGPIIFTDINNISSNIPELYELKQNYPNPFNSQTTIEIEIKENSNVNLILYDVLGKEIVKLLQNENYRQGSYKVKLDFSRWLTPSGIYFYRLEATNKNNNTTFTQSKKMVYLK